MSASCSRCVAVGGVQLGQRAVQHLVRQAARQRLEHALDRLAARQQLARARELDAAPVVGLAVQRLDQRHRGALVEPVGKALHAGVDDGLGLLDGGLALLAGGLHQRRQVVHRVEVDVGQARDLGLDVARHRQVDHEHRAVPARLQRALDRAQADDRQRAGGAGDDGVEFVQPRAAGRPAAATRRRSAPASLSPRSSVRLATAIALGRARREVRGHQFDHLAGADEQHADLAQVLEQLRRQPHRGGGHADRMGADLGRGAHLLGDRERALEQLVQRRAQRAGLVGLAHGLLHLAQDLRLAQHHRIEPGGDAEGVARRGAVFHARSCAPATGRR